MEEINAINVLDLKFMVNVYQSLTQRYLGFKPTNRPS